MSDLLKNLQPSEINFVEQYQHLFSRIRVIQTRMDIVEKDMEQALAELEILRQLEKKQNTKNGKK